MKKILIMAAVCCGFSTISQAQLLQDKNNIQVDSVNLDILLDTAPVAAQKKLLKNKHNLEVQLNQLYLRKVLAKMAVIEGL
ncbi:MAG: hypothetical protein HOE45_04390, partial [Gammaproteobacteria bacterium]|nr:hypothetical protein [Gammaproteobacteria bacterium]